MGRIIAEIGDTVEHEGKEFEVSDISFSNDTAECHYLFVGKDEWVNHRECIVKDNFSTEFFDGDIRSPHLEDLGYNTYKWLEGLPDQPDNSRLPAVMSALMAIQYHKETGYGSSWKGKGEYRGIMANIDRKYDRLDKMTQDEIEGNIRTLQEQEDMLSRDYETYSEEIGEGKIDTIADLANYTLLYMTYVRERFPNVFKLWTEKNIPQDLLEKLPLLEEHYGE